MHFDQTGWSSWLSDWFIWPRYVIKLVYGNHEQGFKFTITCLEKKLIGHCRTNNIERAVFDSGQKRWWLLQADKSCLVVLIWTHIFQNGITDSPGKKRIPRNKFLWSVVQRLLLRNTLDHKNDPQGIHHRRLNTFECLEHKSLGRKPDLKNNPSPSRKCWHNVHSGKPVLACKVDISFSVCICHPSKFAQTDRSHVVEVKSNLEHNNLEYDTLLHQGKIQACWSWNRSQRKSHSSTSGCPQGNLLLDYSENTSSLFGKRPPGIPRHMGRTLESFWENIDEIYPHRSHSCTPRLLDRLHSSCLHCKHWRLYKYLIYIHNRVRSNQTGWLLNKIWAIQWCADLSSRNYRHKLIDPGMVS